MTQAFNLSQLANRVNTSGQLNVATGASGTLPIANGGTNNGSLAVTAGGALYTDGSKVVNVGAGTSGQVLTSQGASAPIWQTASGGFANMQVFTSSGTFTVPAGITKVKVTVVGGGGNGAGATANGGYAGGGAGGAAIKVVSGLTPASTVSVTVGGIAGTSSFGAHCSATGGTSAPTNGTDASYAGGSGSGGNINFNGEPGVSSLGSAAGGAGGSSILGTGGNFRAANQNGWPAVGYGAGGGGTFRTAGSLTGGAGSSGIVIVEY